MGYRNEGPIINVRPGKAIQEVARFAGVEPEEITIIYDKGSAGIEYFRLKAGNRIVGTGAAFHCPYVPRFGMRLVYYKLANGLELGERRIVPLGSQGIL